MASGRWYGEGVDPLVVGRNPSRKERGHLRSRSHRKDSQEKPTAGQSGVTVLKLTQVGEMSILRRLERTLVKELGKLTP